jgi:predicted transcriptional regulator
MTDSSDPLDDLYRAIADGRRRELLFALVEHNPQEEISIPDDVPPGDRDRRRVHVEMVHNHLPLLEEMGFIEWDREAHHVVKGPQFTAVRPVLEALREYHETNLTGK